MFERFTAQARRAIVLAQEQARRFDHDHVGTEHLLLGLIWQGDGTAAMTLTSLGIGLDDARRQVEQVVQRGPRPPVGHIPFTDHAQQVLNLSLREALRLGHNYLGTEHLLLGVLREDHSRGGTLLLAMTGMEREQIREQVLRQLAANSEQPSPPESQTEQFGITRPPTQLFASVTFDVTEHALVLAAAAKAGQPVAEWMKVRLLAAARTDTPPTG